MANLFEPPPNFTLVLSKGQDIYFGLIYKPLVVDAGGNPILDGDGKKQFAEADYPAGAVVTATIETSPPAAQNLEIEATIEGSVATIWGDIVDADQVKPGALWRATITYADGLDKVLANGKVARADG